MGRCPKIGMLGAIILQYKMFKESGEFLIVPSFAKSGIT